MIQFVENMEQSIPLIRWKIFMHEINEFDRETETKLLRACI